MSSTQLLDFHIFDQFFLIWDERFVVVINYSLVSLPFALCAIVVLIFTGLCLDDAGSRICILHENVTYT